MTEIQPPPLPVQPLGYATESRELWVVLSRAITVAAVALATFQLVVSSCQIGMAAVQDRISLGVSLNLANPRNAVFLAIELAGDAAAALVLVTALMRRRITGNGRSMLAGCLIALVVIHLLTWILRTMATFMTANFITQLGTAGAVIYFLLNLASLFGSMLLPLLLVWLLTRPIVRMHYDAGVSTT